MPLTLPDGPSPIADRLLNPADSVPLAVLPRRWFQQTVVVVVAGLGTLARDPSLPGRVRGAWGHQLMRAASDAALADQPCPWDPPCAYDVLFREQGRLTPGLGLPRPTVLAAEAVRPDLTLRLTVFGFACDWVDSAGEALIAAVREGNPLRQAPHQRQNDSVAPTIRRRRIETAESVALPESARVAELDFVTPLCLRDRDVAGFGGPGSLIASLGNRVSGLARWQDCTVEADWRALIAQAETLSCDASGLRPVRWTRGSARQGGRKIPMEGLAGRLVLEGDLTPLLPLLVLGAIAHVGSHAALGLGAYSLTLG